MLCCVVLWCVFVGMCCVVLWCVFVGMCCVVLCYVSRVTAVTKATGMGTHTSNTLLALPEEPDTTHTAGTVVYIHRMENVWKIQTEKALATSEMSVRSLPI